MTKRFLVWTLVVLALLCPRAGLAFEVPSLKGRVNDYAELLTPDQHISLEGTLRALEEKTTAQVAFLTVKDLQNQDIKSFAHTVATTWKLGQRGKDNGVLVLYTVKEDRYRIEVGYGLEGAIPDGIAGDIIRQQLRTKADPKKGAHDFHAAFVGAVGVIAERITTEPEKKAVSKYGALELVIILVLFGLVPGTFIFLIFLAAQPWFHREPGWSKSSDYLYKRTAYQSSRNASQRRRGRDDDSSLLGSAIGSNIGSSGSSSSNSWSGSSSDSGYSGGGGDSGGGGADG